MVVPGARGDLRGRLGRDPHQVRPRCARAGPSSATARLGGFLLTVGTAFGYAAGWTPYAADYTRYLPSTVSTARDRAVRLGRAVPVLRRCWRSSARRRSPSARRCRRTRPRRSPASWRRRLAKATLLAIAIGAIAANSINIYSGAMAFVTIGVKLPAHIARALVTVFFGVAGFLVAWWALPDAAAQLRGVPADHRLLDRAVARRGVRRPVPAARAARSPDSSTTASYANWGGLASFADRPRGVGAAVLQPGEVRRVRRPAVPAAGRHHVLRRVPAGRRRIPGALQVEDRRGTCVAGMTPEDMLDVAVEEARKGLSEGGIPIGAALFSRGRRAARQRAQPAGAGRRPVGARRDRRVPRGRPAAGLPVDDHGDDAVAVLVLQRPGAAVQHRRGRHRREPRRSAAATTGWPRTASTSRFSTTSGASR